VIPAHDSFYPRALEVVDGYLAVVDRVPAGGFTELRSFDELPDGAGVERDSRTWAKRFFRPAASPYADGADVKRYAHRAVEGTFDLLWHMVTVEDELDVAVIESVKFVLVRVHPRSGPVLSPDEAATATAIAALADRVLAMTGTAPGPFGGAQPYRWTFQYQQPLGDGARFSTAPDADPPVLASFTERLDGGIHHGHLFFLGHKVRSGDGRIVSLDARHWFDGQCWRPYAAVPLP
jgi:hypothetical protein